MDKPSLEAMEYLHRNEQIKYLPGTGLSGEICQINFSVDSSWGWRGWSSWQGIVNECFEETDKVLDVILKASLCGVYSSLKSKRESSEIKVMDYIEIFKTWTGTFD